MVPELGKEIGGFEQNALAAMVDANNPHQDAEQEQWLVREVLVGYAKKLAEHHDRVLTVEDLAEIEILSAEHPASFETEPARREAFGKISRFLHDRLGLPKDANVEAELRSASLEDGGFDLFGQSIRSAASEDAPFPSSGAFVERCLETEFVAIYW